MDCRECDKRDNNCTQLCDDAEVFVNQDYKGQRELPIGLPLYMAAEWPDMIKPVLTKREITIVTMMSRGLERSDVAKILGITRETLRKALQRLRGKCHALDYSKELDKWTELSQIVDGW